MTEGSEWAEYGSESEREGTEQRKGMERGIWTRQRTTGRDGGGRVRISLSLRALGIEIRRTGRGRMVVVRAARGTRR